MSKLPDPKEEAAKMFSITEVPDRSGSKWSNGTEYALRCIGYPVLVCYGRKDGLIHTMDGLIVRQASFIRDIQRRTLRAAAERLEIARTAPQETMRDLAAELED